MRLNKGKPRVCLVVAGKEKQNEEQLPCIINDRKPPNFSPQATTSKILKYSFL